MSAPHLREATDEFNALLASRLPLAFLEGKWSFAAAGLLARMGRLLDSLALLVESGRNADGQVLLRVIYEHATTFCWLGIDPAANVETWKEWSRWRSVKLHNDAKDFGIEVLTDRELAAMEPNSEPRSLPQLAEEVDAYWSSQSAAFRRPPKRKRHPLTFRGLYTAIYRKGSSLIHTTEAGLSRQAKGTASQYLVVMEEQPPGNPDIPAIAIPLSGFMLIVYHHHFGWPPDEVVRGITEGVAPEIVSR